MMNKLWNNLQKKIIVIALASLLILSCAQRIYDVAYPTLNDGQYDSEFPYRNCSKQLEEISASVKLINCMAFFESYIFSKEEMVVKADILQKILNYDKEILYDHHPVSGTATIISKAFDKVLILTCAHIVDFPDTLYAFYQNDANEPKYLQSVAVLSNIDLYINDIPNGDKLEILATDYPNDIALLGVDIGRAQNFIPVFDYPIGSSHELEWGSFVYILGYPIGNKMITRGIVSNPGNAEKSTFLIDALFNKGFSGGLVLAIRDGVPNFELVGIAQSVSAEYNYILVPDKERYEYNYNLQLPYTGKSRVALKEEINYGITHAISIEAIQSFIKKNKRELESKGYRTESFLKK
ncbi:MAG: hypothetical protein DRI23_01875 [Candidatus Cloacimonadota bacterium]|nr:MAG: hypothetical protein DRI23_01875 [Candidatus Cloacimonadota bacterium]